METNTELEINNLKEALYKAREYLAQGNDYELGLLYSGDEEIIEMIDAVLNQHKNHDPL